MGLRFRSARAWKDVLLVTVCLAAIGYTAWDVSATILHPRTPAAEGEPLTVPKESVASPASEPVSPRGASGRLPTRVVVPSAGIDAAVVELGIVRQGGEAVWEVPWRAAGHLMTTSLPGQPGNVVIVGHVSVADPQNLAVFANLRRVSPGDVIEIESGLDRHRYIVRDVFEVDPTETWVLRSGPGATATLITCTEDLQRRLVVRAELDSSVRAVQPKTIATGMP